MLTHQHAMQETQPAGMYIPSLLCLLANLHPRAWTVAGSLLRQLEGADPAVQGHEVRATHAHGHLLLRLVLLQVNSEVAHGMTLLIHL